MSARVGRRKLRLMNSASDGLADRKVHSYRIAVRGQITQPFVEQLGQVVVEQAGRESILLCHAVDSAKLQSILNWLYERGIEIASVSPDDGGDDPPGLCARRSV
jgi:hypothetical protein